jgi:hypothetical protein
VYRREYAGRLGVRHLHVEYRLLVFQLLNRVLNERRLTDASATSHLGKEPALAVEHSLKICELFPSTVELSVRHRLRILDKAMLP